jgi:hypothetical protein
MQKRQKKKFSELNLFQEDNCQNGDFDENEEFPMEMIKDLLFYSR